jgi:class 3 adenylate cyclase
MKIKNVTASFCRKTMQHSLPVDMMIRFAKLVNPSYNFYRRAGLREGQPISNQDAAQRIVADLIEDGCFIDFVEKLIQIDARGYMGRRYNLKGMDNVVNGVIQEGYSYDKSSGQFFENQHERITENWGRLKEGDERNMTLLRFDIAGNSILVKNNPPEKIKKAYGDLRIIITRAVTSRLGRLWSWEGDGALAAFLFGPTERTSVYCGMEILHEIFIYNRIGNPLSTPIKVRMGIHLGSVRYSENVMERLKNETANQAAKLEETVPDDSLGVSYNLYITMDQATLNLFGPEKTCGAGKYRSYRLSLEKA